MRPNIFTDATIVVSRFAVSGPLGTGRGDSVYIDSGRLSKTGCISSQRSSSYTSIDSNENLHWGLTMLWFSISIYWFHLFFSKTSFKNIFKFGQFWALRSNCGHLRQSFCVAILANSSEIVPLCLELAACKNWCPEIPEISDILH